MLMMRFAPQPSMMSTPMGGMKIVIRTRRIAGKVLLVWERRGMRAWLRRRWLTVHHLGGSGWWSVEWEVGVSSGS